MSLAEAPAPARGQVVGDRTGTCSCVPCSVCLGPGPWTGSQHAGLWPFTSRPQQRSQLASLTVHTLGRASDILILWVSLIPSVFAQEDLPRHCLTAKQVRTSVQRKFVAAMMDLWLFFFFFLRSIISFPHLPNLPNPEKMSDVILRSCAIVC